MRGSQVRQNSMIPATDTEGRRYYEQVEVFQMMGDTGMIRVQFLKDGAIQVTNAQTESFPSESKLPEIVKLVSDPNSSAAETLRLISVEIVRLLALSNPSLNSNFESHNDEIKALRLLARIVKEAGMRSKADVLNFEKPKFKYVLAQTISMLEEATSEVLDDKDRAKTEMIMKRFEDILAEKQQDLRRRTEEIGRESVAQASQSKPSANSSGA
jgi:hypothetical protein